ncbi:MAG: gamma-glutamyl-gamma-aminobutyrate hydrolase family protein [Gemmatimonadaceae bacterium]
MPVRPVIGITTQTLDAVPGELPRCWVMSQRYVLALAEAGGVPQLVPLLCDDPATLRLIYERLDGLLLPGGVDIDPSAYGAARSSLCGRTDPDRDRTELMLTRWAMAERKPVLGICRGVQLINVAAGGTLYQDIAAEHTGAIKHDYFPNGEQNPRNQLVHEVELTAGSRLEDILTVSGTRVNSMHHQGIRDLAPDLVAAARAPDGVIEALESPDDAFVFGVQWHPEDLTDTDRHMRRLFERLLGEAAAFSRRPALGNRQTGMGNR